MVCCDQVIRWKLDSIGMNPTAESYLLLHRFGTVRLAVFLHDIVRLTNVGTDN